MANPANNAPSQPDTVWHLDKRVPVALIFTILLQTVGAGIWVGTIASRVTSLEERVIEQKKQIETGAEVGQNTAISLAGLKEAVNALKEAQQEGFRRIEETLRRTDRARPGG